MKNDQYFRYVYDTNTKRITILTILSNGICNNQNSLKKMMPIKLSGILRYKRIILSQPEDRTLI